MDVNWAAALAALRVDNSVELKAVLSAALKAALKADQKVELMVVEMAAS